MNDYADRMTQQNRDRSFKNRRPRDAATVIMLDKRDDRHHVLLGRRHDRHVFLPGKFVFPGGRVDATDGRAPAAAELDDTVVEKLLADMKRNGGSYRARALGLAAIREVFEETGIAIGRPHEGRLPKINQWNDFFGLGLAPDLSVLRFVARAVTPPGRPRRFDTRFFVVDMTETGHSTDEMMRPCDELDQLVWTPIDEASKLDMPAVTTVVLDELANRLPGDPHLKAPVPIPYYCWKRDRFVRYEI
ncbi:NUDIX hydrolase [Tepidamorphus sp. 3E244]|uniref:NUDIX hydrolase n=1 Tax=Tepidamorphus sp. 3E244 TaxID=3385498 RepID=UPI0038FC9C4F